MDADLHKPAERVLAALLGEAWAISHDGHAKLVEIASRENIVTPEVIALIATRREAVIAKKATKMDGTDAAVKRDGVALIEVAGPIFRYADLFSQISGATTIETLATDFNAAINDPSVMGVVFIFDSPGGQVSGVNEFANQIYAARGTKPIVGYIGNMCASAAYWFGSACDELVIDATADAGSIGTVVSARKSPPRDAVVEVTSKQSPKKRMDPDTEAGRAELQSVADTLAQVFVETVARNRGMSVDDVVASEGRMFIGQAAVACGLVDRVGSLESVIAEISSGATPANRSAANNNQAPAFVW